MSNKVALIILYVLVAIQGVELAIIFNDSRNKPQSVSKPLTMPAGDTNELITFYSDTSNINKGSMLSENSWDTTNLHSKSNSTVWSNGRGYINMSPDEILKSQEEEKHFKGGTIMYEYNPDETSTSTLTLVESGTYKPCYCYHFENHSEIPKNKHHHHKKKVLYGTAGIKK